MCFGFMFCSVIHKREKYHTVTGGSTLGQAGAATPAKAGIARVPPILLRWDFGLLQPLECRHGCCPGSWLELEEDPLPTVPFFSTLTSGPALQQPKKPKTKRPSTSSPITPVPIGSTRKEVRVQGLEAGGAGQPHGRTPRSRDRRRRRGASGLPRSRRRAAARGGGSGQGAAAANGGRDGHCRCRGWGRPRLWP